MRRMISLLAVAAFCAGCTNEAGDCHNTLSCPLPPDAGATVPVASDTACGGQCVRGNNFDWQEPWMVYLGGDQSQAPFCPDNAPNVRDYRAATPAKPCAACECNPPTGACSLPATANANNAACPATDSGTVHTSFDPPSGWDGACTAQQAIAANLDCDGGPCVQSITFAPLVLTEEGCTPKPPIVPLNNPQSLTFARTCGGTTRGNCSDASNVCVPGLPAKMGSDPGFWTYCVSQHGTDDAYTMTCPMGYPNKYVLSIDYHDSRGCAPCLCDPPEGSMCSSLVTVYTDNACSDAQEFGSITVSATAPSCLNLPPGSPLGSKTATAPFYKPGSCKATGGESTGSVENIGPTTFCCQQ